MLIQFRNVGAKRIGAVKERAGECNLSLWDHGANLPWLYRRGKAAGVLFLPTLAGWDYGSMGIKECWLAQMALSLGPNGGGVQRGFNWLKQRVDLILVDDHRRAEGEGIANGAQDDAVF